MPVTPSTAAPSPQAFDPQQKMPRVPQLANETLDLVADCVLDRCVADATKGQARPSPLPMALGGGGRPVMADGRAHLNAALALAHTSRSFCAVVRRKAVSDRYFGELLTLYAGFATLQLKSVRTMGSWYEKENDSEHWRFVRSDILSLRFCRDYELTHLVAGLDAAAMMSLAEDVASRPPDIQRLTLSDGQPAHATLWRRGFNHPEIVTPFAEARHVRIRNHHIQGGEGDIFGDHTFDHLETLTLNNAGLSLRQLRALAKTVLQSPRLESLDLGANELTQKDVERAFGAATVFTWSKPYPGAPLSLAFCNDVGEATLPVGRAFTVVVGKTESPVWHDENRRFVSRTVRGR